MDLMQRYRDNPLPFSEWLGVRLVSAAPDRVVGEMTVRPDLCTRPPVAHGGAVMAFADTLGALGTVAVAAGTTATATVVVDAGGTGEITAGEAFDKIEIAV